MTFDKDVCKKQRGAFFLRGFRPHTGPGRANTGPYGSRKFRKLIRNHFTRGLYGACHPALSNSLQCRSDPTLQQHPPDYLQHPP